MAGQKSAPLIIGSMCLIFFVEQQLEGWTFERKSWPLHVTLVPWFTITDEEAVMRGLERLALETTALDIAVGQEVMFGERKNVPVNVLVDQSATHRLHDALLQSLGQADIAAEETPFIRDEYVAHITRQKDGRHSSPGERILLNNFQVVRLINDTTCEVAEQFFLKR